MAEVIAKCSDLCTVSIGDNERNGCGAAVPSDMGIGGGDYIRFAYCLDCGQLDGDSWPMRRCALEDEE